MNSIQPADFATEQQLARNHARLQQLPVRSDSLLSEWETEQARERAATYEAERDRILAEEAKRARGDDLPLFA